MPGLRRWAGKRVDAAVARRDGDAVERAKARESAGALVLAAPEGPSRVKSSPCGSPWRCRRRPAGYRNRFSTLSIRCGPSPRHVADAVNRNPPPAGTHRAPARSGTFHYFVQFSPGMGLTRAQAGNARRRGAQFLDFRPAVGRAWAGSAEGRSRETRSRCSRRGRLCQK